MQELPTGRAGPPQHDLTGATGLRVVESTDQRRQDVRGLWVEIVVGAVQVGRHRRDPGPAILSAVGLHLQDAGDLGNGVGVVGRFECTREQARLLDRLLGELGVDAG